jgi:type I restriction enzyme R subunit
MIADPDAVFVALTGTPLLATKERSTMKFGEYIHKYFYDKSIADGYTLRIKRENIETNARSNIRMNLLLENPDKSKKVIRESPEYVSAVGAFIDEDFQGFRLQNFDRTLGGMIVCSSNPQAKLMKSWFDRNSILKTGLILSDVEITSNENKEVQKSFKRNVDEYDMLIVHNMLTTGYDVAHLKKMYLLRNAHEQTLLQIISRVNRPYRAPATKKSYRYGYIVDFVDIEAEFDRTIEKYLAELSADFALQGEDGVSFKGLVVGPEEIRQQCDVYFAAIAEIIDISNIEKFSREIWHLDLMRLYEIRKCLNGILACRTEFILSRNYEYAKEIDDERIKSLLREVQNSISLKNLKESPADTLLLLSDEEVVSIIYEFLKTSVKILDMGKFEDIKGELGETFKKIKREYGKVKNPHQIELIRLNELLQEIFSKMEISSAEELKVRNDELLGVLDAVSNLNAENERIAEKYDGNYAFVKTYTDCIEMHPELPREDVEMLVARVYHSVKDISAKNRYLLEKRDTFVKTVMSETIEYLYDSESYDRLHLDTWYEDELLKNAYDNIKIFA